jgi:hypothetical protein
MASTYSSLKIELIGTGLQAGTWGNTTNTNLGTAIEEAIVGRATADFPSDANLTLTLTNTNVSQVARHFVLNVTSSVSLTVTRDLVVPAIEKPYIVQNNTTGGQSIRVIVAGASVTVPNGKTAFVYNDGTNVGHAFDVMGALSLAGALDVAGDGNFTATTALKLPVGTTAQRPTPADGKVRFNTDTTKFEGYNGTSWGQLGGGATGGGSDEVFVENGQVVTSNYTLPGTKNAMSTGPITINSGVTVTVSSGARYVII